MSLNWSSIHAGKISREEILRHCQNGGWQELRLKLKGISLEEKFRLLKEWLETHNHSRAAQVQVTNYINALARAGLI